MANNPQPTGMQPVQHHMMGNLGPPPNQFHPMSMQFRPMGPHPPPFAPMAAQQYQPGGYSNVGMQLPPPAPMQYHPAMQPPFQQPRPLPQPPQWQHTLQPSPQTPGLTLHIQSQGQAIPPPDLQPNRPVMPASAPPHMYNNMMSNSGDPRFSHVSYNLSLSSDGQQQVNAVPTTTQADPSKFPVGQPWFPPGNQHMQSGAFPQVVQQQTGERAWFSGGTTSVRPLTPQPNGEQDAGKIISNGNQNDSSGSGSQPTSGVAADQTIGAGRGILADAHKTESSIWKEYTSPQGKKYYYNKTTSISSWEKPLELMTLTEKADSSTDWREITSSDRGRFFFNKVTKQSRWAIPDEVKLAREQAGLVLSEGRDADPSSATVHTSGVEASVTSGNNVSLAEKEIVPCQAPESAAGPQSSGIEGEVTIPASASTPKIAEKADEPSSERIFERNLEELNKGAGTSESGGGNTPDEINADYGVSARESKEEAKIAFRALLESANIGSEWTWDQAMRVIINDRRYGSLKSLGERKQAFNEFLGQKKKREAEDKRAKQKRAKEDFKVMLQECKDLTSSVRWSKAISIFEKDERFQAVERSKDREDLFEAHIEDLKKKERAKAVEEHKRHKVEYLEFLKSCDFIKASSQWRKIQHRLEVDERCSRLQKLERLEIFQEYIRDLEMEEEEQRKLRMEEVRKAERRNRDEFRKLIDEHVMSGVLTIDSHWRDYVMKVKDTPAYLSVSLNTSGPTAKDLFDDVIDDLEKQYSEDKELIEEAMRNQKITLSTTWNLEDFKHALSENFDLKQISGDNLRLVFHEILENKKEKEEKEVKRRKRLAEDIYEFLYNLKELAASSKWEEIKPYVEERFVGEEYFFMEIFDSVIEEVKEMERRRERNRKELKKYERKDKEKRKERERRHSHSSRKDKEMRIGAESESKRYKGGGGGDEHWESLEDGVEEGEVR